MSKFDERTVAEKEIRKKIDEERIKQNTSPVVAHYIANYMDAHPGKKLTRFLRWKLSREAWHQRHKQNE